MMEVIRNGIKPQVLPRDPRMQESGTEFWILPPPTDEVFIKAIYCNTIWFWDNKIIFLFCILPFILILLSSYYSQKSDQKRKEYSSNVKVQH